MEVYTAVTHTSTSGVSIKYDMIQEKVNGLRKNEKCKRMWEKWFNLWTNHSFESSSDHKYILIDLFSRKTVLFKAQVNGKKWPEQSQSCRFQTTCGWVKYNKTVIFQLNYSFNNRTFFFIFSLTLPHIFDIQPNVSLTLETSSLRRKSYSARLT